MIYIIDYTIVFDTRKNTLSLLNDEAHAIKLSASACRLLSELIAKKGETIPRDYLLKKVWDDYGFTGSNNNLSTYMSEIRQSLMSLNQEIKAISTIPKEGFRLDSHIESIVNTPIVKNDEINALKHAPDLTKKNSDDECNGFKNAYYKIQKGRYLHHLIISVALVSFSFSVIYFIKTPTINQESYWYLENIKNCRIFLLDNANQHQKVLIKKSVENEIELEKIDCTSTQKHIFYKETLSNNEIGKITFIGDCTLLPSGEYNHCRTIKVFSEFNK